MHTVLVISGGLVLPAVFVAVGRWAGQSAHALARADLLFVPVWCVAAAMNMWIGVSAAVAVVVRWASLRRA